MKSTFLQQVKFIADGTTAFDRTGFNSAMIIVNGGTADKDIKIQTGGSSSQSDLRVIGTSGGAGTQKVIQTPINDCKSYIKITGTSLTSVEVVLGDADIHPADSSAVVL